MDKIALFIFNIFINSFLAFFTAVLLIEAILILFRIRQGRAAATLRMIPLFKLPLDLFLYDFSRWSYLHHIDPLQCQEGTRTLSAMIGLNNSSFPLIMTSIESTVPEGMTFTIADIIGRLAGPYFLRTFALLFVSFSLYFVLKKLIFYYRSIQALNILKKTFKPSSRTIYNSKLALFLQTSKLPVLSSFSVPTSPFVAGLISSKIYFPSDLDLSEKEYEAALAHEIEHIRYKDNLVRLSLDFIRSVFWWIPTAKIHHRIEEGQEVGCDRKCHQYGIDPLDLASAICKSAKYSIHSPYQIFSEHLTTSTIHKRITLLLHPTKRSKILSITLVLLAMGIVFFAILFGRFWIF